MTEQSTENQQKGGKGKISVLIILIIAALGGAITLFLILQTSDKQTYFSAELDTYDYLKNEVEERFADELAWTEMTEENPTESTVDISAEYQDPYAFGGVSEIEEIVNNSTISITSQTDIQEKMVFADVEADVAGMTFDDIRVSLDETKFLLQLPFLEDVLQIDSEDIGPLLHEIDPYTFEEDANYDFSQVFNRDDYPIPADDREYLKEKYGKFLYDELPEDAFSSEKEEVDVDGESVKAEKVTVHLTEDDVKTLVTNFAEEMENDDRLKEIIEVYFENNFMPTDELDMLMDDFVDALEEMKEDVDEITLPEGIESSIWVESGLIVKRHFALTTEDNFGDEVTFNIEGTQLLDDKKQTFDYDINFKDDFNDETITLVGDLSWDDDVIDDTITLGFDEFEIVYEGDETYKDSNREFERSLSVQSPFLNGGLFWTGDSTYEKDQMSANHQLHVEADDIGEDMLSIQLAVDGKQVKEIETVEADNVKDIGKMSEAELDAYIEGDAAEQFFAWYMEMFGDVGF